MWPEATNTFLEGRSLASAVVANNLVKKINAVKKYKHHTSY